MNAVVSNLAELSLLPGRRDRHQRASRTDECTHTSRISIRSGLYFLCLQILRVPPACRLSEVRITYNLTDQLRMISHNAIQGDKFGVDFITTIALDLAAPHQSLQHDTLAFELSQRTWKKNSKSLEAGSKLVIFSSSAFMDSWRR